jgi:Ca2+-binding RTX toxin-like protein
MATIHGTNFNDNDTLQFPLGFVKKVGNSLSLTSSDTLYGYAGDDIIEGDGGNDVIYGDRSSSSFTSLGLHGNDLIYGGSGNDRLYGDGGNDRLYGGADNDILDGGDGNDQLFGGTNSAGGTDQLFGGSGNDTLYGDDSETIGGVDLLFGGSGDDKLFGRAGNDRLQGQSSSTSLSMFEKDELTGGAGSDTFVVSGLYQNGGSNDFVLTSRQVVLQVQTKGLAGDGAVKVYGPDRGAPGSRSAPVVAGKKYTSLLVAEIGTDGTLAVAPSVPARVRISIVGWVHR